MKILHIYKDYFPVLGGIENHVRVLAEAQASQGHKVTACVCSPGPESSESWLNGVRLVRAGRLGTAASMPLSWKQPLLLRKEAADILHLHSPYPLGEVSAWLGRHGIPLVITHHADVIRQKNLMRLYGPVYRRILAHARRLIVTSEAYLRSSRWLSPHAAKSRTVPLGVDSQFFHPAEKQAPFSGRILFVGRLRYYKGLDNLLHALVPLPDVRLTIAGDGPMRGKWESLTRQLGISGRVSFLGEIDDATLAHVYHQADLFVLPANSRAEAFGTVLLEAMACGLPCLTTEVGTGSSWVVQDGVTGCVVPPDQPAVLCAAIQNLFSDPEKLRRMGRAGRARVEQEFTVQRMIDRVMRVYEECAEKKESLTVVS